MLVAVFVFWTGSCFQYIGAYLNKRTDGYQISVGVDERTTTRMRENYESVEAIIYQFIYIYKYFLKTANLNVKAPVFIKTPLQTRVQAIEGSKPSRRKSYQLYNSK